jgi:hypothetical protein
MFDNLRKLQEIINTLKFLIESEKFLKESNMKHLKLKQIIKEEIRNVLEQSDYDTSLRNLTTPQFSGGNKIRMPKKIEVIFNEKNGRYYRTKINDNTNVPGFLKFSDTEKFIKSKTGIDISLQHMPSEGELKSVKNNLADDGIEFTWSEMDLS